MLAQGELVAVLHFEQAVGELVETAHHVERLLVADNLHPGIELLDECQRAAVVGLHVVDHHVVELAVAQHFAKVLKERHEEVHFNGVDEAGLFIVDEISIVADTVGQGPEALEERLVTIVDAYVENFLGNLFHSFYLLVSLMNRT